MPGKTATKTRAGILLFRQAGKDLQVFLGHPGGPFWSRKDLGVWTLPKGLIAPGEDPLAAAQREFAEETGHVPQGEFISSATRSSREARSFTYGQCKKTGKRIYCAAIHSRWNGRQNPDGGRVSPSLTAPAGLLLPKRVRRF
jgi:ADP-ribose pyrophosphatase YjhB (NUDIX family)